MFPTDDWAGWLDARVAAHLDTVREKLATLKDGTRRETAEILELWNDADLALRGADTLTALLLNVHPDEEVRALAERHAQDIDRVRTERGLDRALFDVLDATDPAGLDAQAARMREHVLRDFRRSGVDQPENWRQVGRVQNTTLWLTADETLELAELRDEWISAKKGRTKADHPDGARRVRFTSVVVPVQFE